RRGRPWVPPGGSLPEEGRGLHARRHLPPGVPGAPPRLTSRGGGAPARGGRGGGDGPPVGWGRARGAETPGRGSAVLHPGPHGDGPCVGRDPPPHRRGAA